jgi:hypothetical protein
MRCRLSVPWKDASQRVFQWIRKNHHVVLPCHLDLSRFRSFRPELPMMSIGLRPVLLLTQTIPQLFCAL